MIEKMKEKVVYVKPVLSVVLLPELMGGLELPISNKSVDDEAAKQQNFYIFDDDEEDAGGEKNSVWSDNDK